MRRAPLPLGPTLLVLIAVPMMVALGFWQLDRRDQKEALFAALTRAAAMSPLDGRDIRTGDRLDFRRTRIDCRLPAQTPAVRGGASRDGVPGFLYIVTCEIGADAATTGLALPTIAGWAARPDQPLRLTPGHYRLTGVLVRDGGRSDPSSGLKALPYLLIANEALPPLRPSRQPSIADIPNNHLSYAGQWFFFALTLSVIYAIYVRRWRRARSVADEPRRD